MIGSAKQEDQTAWAMAQCVNDIKDAGGSRAWPATSKPASADAH